MKLEEIEEICNDKYDIGYHAINALLADIPKLLAVARAAKKFMEPYNSTATQVAYSLELAKALKDLEK